MRTVSGKDNMVNELSFCDDDIISIFRGRKYTPGMPMTLQLIKDVRQLNPEKKNKPIKEKSTT